MNIKKTLKYMYSGLEYERSDLSQTKETKEKEITSPSKKKVYSIRTKKNSDQIKTVESDSVIVTITISITFLFTISLIFIFYIVAFKPDISCFVENIITALFSGTISIWLGIFTAISRFSPD